MNEILKQLLVRIGAGETTFRPRSESIEDLRAFHSTVESLIQAELHGFIHGVRIHKESQTGERMADLVQLAGLTEYGQDNIGGLL